MMRMMKMSVVMAAVFFLAGSAGAAQYTWTDADGKYNSTDRLDRLPEKYKSLIRYDVTHFVTPEGYGFDVDEKGDMHFFDHSSPASRIVTRTAPSAKEIGGPPGSPVTVQELAEMKRRYGALDGEKKPEIVTIKVKRVLAPDLFELDNGQAATYNGIGFPEELQANAELFQEAIRYQKKLMEGKTVNLLYGPRRVDDQGRLLVYVMIGTDMFVNADLVMNGYARVKTVPPNTDYSSLFQRLEEFASKSMLGMWASNGKDGSSVQIKND